MASLDKAESVRGIKTNFKEKQQQKKEEPIVPAVEVLDPDFPELGSTHFFFFEVGVHEPISSLF